MIKADRPSSVEGSSRKPIGLALHAEGLAAGRQFIARHGNDIGTRETLDLGGAVRGDLAPERCM
jgi:hypothetical protein